MPMATFLEIVNGLLLRSIACTGMTVSYHSYVHTKFEVRSFIRQLMR